MSAPVGRVVDREHDGSTPVAWAQELTRAAVVDELAHELASAVTFLAALVDDLRRCERPDAKDVAIAVDEAARLKALMRELRRVAYPVSRPRVIEVADLLATVRLQSLAAREQRQLAWRTTLPLDFRLAADETYAHMLLAAVVRVAIENAVAGSELSVSGVVDAEAVTVALSLAPAGSRPLLPTEALWRLDGGAPLELALAMRVARAHGHRLRERHEDGRVSLLWILPHAARGPGSEAG